MSFTKLSTEAIEKSSYFITSSFYDEDGLAVTPNADTIKWTLTDQAGTVINDRDNEAITSASVITIELEGEDLSFLETELGPIARRKLTLLWEYDSILGNDKPGKDECMFDLRRLTRIPADA